MTDVRPERPQGPASTGAWAAIKWIVGSFGIAGLLGFGAAYNLFYRVDQLEKAANVEKSITALHTSVTSLAAAMTSFTASNERLSKLEGKVDGMGEALREMRWERRRAGERGLDTGAVRAR